MADNKASNKPKKSRKNLRSNRPRYYHRKSKSIGSHPLNEFPEETDYNNEIEKEEEDTVLLLPNQNKKAKEKTQNMSREDSMESLVLSENLIENNEISLISNEPLMKRVWMRVYKTLTSSWLNVTAILIPFTILFAIFNWSDSALFIMSILTLLSLSNLHVCIISLV